jgi:ppGpp synthetase/RelA/SpoT-type nucleotidyltranferase
MDGDVHISAFVDKFKGRRQSLEKLSHKLEEVVNEHLEKNGVKHFFWESRVKDPESLRRKLQIRANDYDSPEDNCQDIQDLVGGRILLLHSEHMETVKELFHDQQLRQQEFRAENRKDHSEYHEDVVILAGGKKKCFVLITHIT